MRILALMAGGLLLIGPGQGRAANSTQAGVRQIQDDALLTYTLEEAIQRGLEANPQVLEQEQEVRKAEAQIGSKRGGFLPSLGLNLDHSDINSLSSQGPSDSDYIDQTSDLINLRLTQTLFAGLTVFNDYQKSILNKELTQAQKDQAEEELILEIQKRFLTLLKAQAEVKSLKETVNRLEVNVDSAQAFFDQDMAPYVRVLEAEVDLADARQKLSQAQNKVRVERVQLNILLDYPVSRKIEFSGNLEEVSVTAFSELEACLACALDNRPEMQIIHTSLEMADKQKAILWGRWAPSVQLEGNYYYRDRDFDSAGQDVFGNPTDRDQVNEYWDVGVSLQWQLFQGGKRYYDLKNIEHEMSRLTQRRKIIENAIESEVRTSYLSLQESGQRILFTRTSQKEARENYNRARKRFTTQIGTVSEVLDAQARLSRAESNTIQALADYQLALASLYKSMGVRNLSLDPGQGDWQSQGEKSEE